MTNIAEFDITDVSTLVSLEKEISAISLEDITYKEQIVFDNLSYEKVSLETSLTSKISKAVDSTNDAIDIYEKKDLMISANVGSKVIEYLSNALPLLMATNGVKTLSDAFNVISEYDVYKQDRQLTMLYNTIHLADNDVTPTEIKALVQSTRLDTVAFDNITRAIKDDIIGVRKVDNSVIEENINSTIALIPVTDSVTGISFGPRSPRVSDLVGDKDHGALLFSAKCTKYRDISSERVDKKIVAKLSSKLIELLYFIKAVDTNDIIPASKDNTYRDIALHNIKTMRLHALHDAITIANTCMRLLSVAYKEDEEQSAVLNLPFISFPVFQ